MPVTAEEFEAELLEMIAAATRQGKNDLEVESGGLHRRLGGYPGDDHRMPACCDVMRRKMRTGDELLHEPPSGYGATLRIRYSLPRNADDAVNAAADTRVPLRDVVVLFLRTDERRAMLSGLKDNERRAILYTFSTVPSLGEIDPNTIPPPPFADREMNRLVGAGLRKIEKWLYTETQA